MGNSHGSFGLQTKTREEENIMGLTKLGPDGRPSLSDEWTTKTASDNRGYNNRVNEEIGQGQTQWQVDNNRGQLGRGLATGGDPYLQSVLGQAEAVGAASGDAGYHGIKEGAFQGMAQDAQGRGANFADYGQADQSRDLGMQARGSLVDALSLQRNAAMGLGPSAAQSQLQMGTDAAARQAMAQAASARGGMARAGAQRMGAMQAGDATQNAAAGAASLRAQEMNQAMGQYGQFSDALRGRDLQAQGMDAAQSQFQAQQAQGARNANDQMSLGLQGMGQKASLAQQMADLQKQQNFQSNFHQSQTHKNATDAAAAGASQGEGASKTNTAMGVASTILSMAPMLFAASDERLKTNVEDGSKDVRSFLDAIGTHKYDYKNDAYGEPGKHVSVMAQELEKTELGKRAVIDTPIGKVVNYGKLLPTTVAAQADLHKRLKALEHKLFAA